MEPNKKDVAERFKALRELLKKNQAYIAADAGVSQSTVTRTESGELYPNFELLFALHTHYNVNIHWLITGQEEMFNKDKKLTREELICQCFDIDKHLVLEMIETMEKSPMVKHTVLGFFTQFKYQHLNLIAMDIEKNASPEKSEKDEPKKEN